MTSASFKLYLFATNEQLRPLYKLGLRARCKVPCMNGCSIGRNRDAAETEWEEQKIRIGAAETESNHQV